MRHREQQQGAQYGCLLGRDEAPILTDAAARQANSVAVLRGHHPAVSVGLG